MTEFIFGQISGVLATCLTFLSYQANTKKWLLIIQSAGTLCTAISYLFLGATSGLVLNIICIMRNVVFYFQKDGSKSTLYSGCGLALVMIGAGAYFWQGWVSLLIIVALALNTIFLSYGKPQLLRKSILFTSTIVLIYNALVISIGGIVNESVAITSSIIGIIRFYKTQKSKKSEEKTN